MLDTAIAAAFEFNEKRLSKKVPLPPARLSEEQAIAFELFAVWCRQHGVRSLPARPTTIALYLQTALADAVAAAEAIRVAHQVHSLPCPVSTDVVRFRLNELSDDKPPRSWRNAEKLIWCELSPEIRAVIKRREQEDSAAVRIAQCELAELRKRLEGAETKSHTEEGTRDEAS
jgi:hypothetical protein